ncbi:hypothetical protein BJY21_004157 [Kineosphaera limosa]|uniref:Uncharacterized protein n=1 Tax=Kineosphaera limosa NBRC 100340 TaxID=1184609 RepID=K6W7G7_9MICO|nr:hypothetical protein [Kineosphaera limosa]NYE02973.1 hypothetical protein [Kineosphaera limosa]GAB95135.1 hypothetical protein KILIM_016_00750 [Kineosphaera limosa NBRC 100340]
MGLFGGPKLPADVDAALGRARGERLLAVGRDERTGGYVAATTHRVAALPAVQSGVAAGDPAAGVEPGPRLESVARPWHEVSGGAWEPMTRTISVTWVDGGRAAQWSLREGGERFAAVFYERVAASVVIDAPVELDGRAVGRVAIRRDLATGQPMRQIAWTRGARPTDPHAVAYADLLLEDLAEQAGLT